MIFVKHYKTGMFYSDCPVLSNPNNGNVSTPEGRTYGETAIYSCQYGYHLDGTGSRVCEANGSWSGIDPSCVWTGTVIAFVGIPMGKNSAPLVADLFLFCYERDFMKDLSSDNQADII